MKIDAIIFDIDGVLVDDRMSYRLASVKSVERYLDLAGIERSPLTLRDSQRLKNIGGFNNDWDVSYAFLLYCLLQNSVSNRLGFSSFCRNIVKKGTGLQAAEKAAKAISGSRWEEILELYDKPRLKAIFQEIYLGSELFENTYGAKACYPIASSLINSEPALIAKSTVEWLSDSGLKVGILTGRPGNEARIALERVGLLGYASPEAIITEDEIAQKGEEYRKPNPYFLLAIKSGLKSRAALYVGDLPDDVRAANSAKKLGNFLCAGISQSASGRKMLKKEGADYVFSSVNGIREVMT